MDFWLKHIKNEAINSTRNKEFTNFIKIPRNANGGGKPPPAAAPNGLGYISRSDYDFGDYGYGKNYVKLLHVHRNGPVHTIREFEVNTHLRLSTQKDYLEGDNRDIIATDTQRNTVYVLAKKHGIKTPEEFGLLICSHFLYTYRHVEEVKVHVEEYPWERLEAAGAGHNHAFVFEPSATRCATVSQKRNGESEREREDAGPIETRFSRVAQNTRRPEQSAPAEDHPVRVQGLLSGRLQDPARRQRPNIQHGRHRGLGVLDGERGRFRRGLEHGQGQRHRVLRGTAGHRDFLALRAEHPLSRGEDGAGQGPPGWYLIFLCKFK